MKGGTPAPEHAENVAQAAQEAVPKGQKKGETVPKVKVHRELKLTKSVTVQAYLYKMECDGNGKGAFELWTTREEMEKIVLVWNHNPLTVTLAFNETQEV